MPQPMTIRGRGIGLDQRDSGLCLPAMDQRLQQRFIGAVRPALLNSQLSQRPFRLSKLTLMERQPGESIFSGPLERLWCRWRGDLVE